MIVNQLSGPGVRYPIEGSQLAQALAIHRHFGNAAHAVGITTSGLTKSIQRLEHYYGQPLFTRDRKNVSPTACGEIVLAGAQAILEREAAIKREIMLVSNLETGHLRIGSDPLLSNSIMAPALAMLLEKYPHLQFSLVTGNGAHLLNLLERREIDLFLSFEDGSLGGQAVEVLHELIPAPTVVGASGHPLADTAGRTLSDYFAYPLVASSLAEWYLEWAENQLRKERSNRLPRRDYYLYSDDVLALKTIARSSSALVALLRTAGTALAVFAISGSATIFMTISYSRHSIDTSCLPA